MDRKIRDSLNFEGTPIKIIYRGKALRDVGRAVRSGALDLSNRDGRRGVGVGAPIGRTPSGLEGLSTEARKKNVDKRGGESVSRGKKVSKRGK